MPGKWFKGNQDEHDNQAGQIQHSRDRQNHEAREQARRDKMNNVGKKATNQDGNKGKR